MPELSLEYVLKTKIPEANCEKFLKPGDPDYPKFPPNMKSVRVGDNAMAPAVPKDSRALICPDDRAKIKDGDLVVALLSEGLLVRRCFLYGDLVVLTATDILAKPRIVNKADCRLWPVVIVLFADTDESQEDD